MNNSDEIREMKDAINELLVQQAILTQKCYAAESLLFEIVSESYPDRASIVFTNYVTMAEEEVNNSLDSLEEILLDPAPSFLLHKKFDFQSNLEIMKRHPLFQNKP